MGGMRRGSGEPAAPGGQPPWGAVGDFIRTQRQLAQLSLRQLAELADVSNPYLSQIERGLHRPSAQVLRGIAKALDLSAESLYTQAGLLDKSPVARAGGSDVEAAIRVDAALSEEQKRTLIGVYRGFLGLAHSAPRSGPRSGTPDREAAAAASRRRKA
jgi:transcriptional regulator with XRE-family HTH domain